MCLPQGRSQCNDSTSVMLKKLFYILFIAENMILIFPYVVNRHTASLAHTNTRTHSQPRTGRPHIHTRTHRETVRYFILVLNSWIGLSELCCDYASRFV